MNRDAINENTKRRLYAESLGRCMNPDCQKELFSEHGNICEKAHIVPYCETADNSFDNLVILCPNCHSEYDKNALFTPEIIKSWKQIRKKEIDKLFSKKFANFTELSKEVVPLLMENKTIYENYYLKNNKIMWNNFEYKVLVNNRKLKQIFENNLNLFQKHIYKEYSNLASIFTFIMHVNEFEITRQDKEKIRAILFPQEINSMFGISPVKDSFLPSTEALEYLITKLHEQGKFEKIVVGDDNPYIQYTEDGKSNKLFLNDTPRLRQFYFDYDCPKSSGVRFEGLNFILKYMKSRNMDYTFLKYNNLREITINGIKVVFIYKYCLSEIELMELAPEKNCTIVNLHNWNGGSCISKQAYELAEKMNVSLLTKEAFYGYANKIRHN